MRFQTLFKVAAQPPVLKNSKREFQTKLQNILSEKVRRHRNLVLVVGHGRPQAWARRGALAPPSGNVKSVLCISSYSQTLSLTSFQIFWSVGTWSGHLVVLGCVLRATTNKSRSSTFLEQEAPLPRRAQRVRRA